MSEDKCLSHSMSEEVIGRTFIRFYNKLRQNENVLPKDSDENCITELGKYSGKYALSELLFCGVCGSPFRRKTWTRNGVKKIYWRCLYHMEKGNDACPQSKGIEEHILHAAICRGLTKSIPCENDVRNTVKTLLAYSLSDNRLLLEYQSLENMINELKAKAETAEKICLATGGNRENYRAYLCLKRY